MSLPHTIVLATSKGGAGKTTLARSLAAHWFRSGYKPAMIDADPKPGLSIDYDPKGPMGEVPVIHAPEEGEIISVIEEFQSKHRPVLVDTAGFRNTTTILALSIADVALIPLQADVEDLREARATYDLVQEINDTDDRKKQKARPLKVYFVLTQTIKGTIVSKHFREQISGDNYPLLTGELFKRVSYSEAKIKGLPPNLLEPDGPAGKDVALLAGEIFEAGS